MGISFDESVPSCRLTSLPVVECQGEVLSMSQLCSAISGEELQPMGISQCDDIAV